MSPVIFANNPGGVSVLPDDRVGIGVVHPVQEAEHTTLGDRLLVHFGDRLLVHLTKHIKERKKPGALQLNLNKRKRLPYGKCLD